jgi:catechol 2,3-dioxygenase-like lactoylglutathione lyase family enzyme
MDHDAEVMAFVATARPDEALVFYRDALGLRFIEDSPFALVFETSGRMLRVQKLPEPFTPAPGTVLGWKVADIRGAIAGMAGRGIVFSRYPGLPQDELGIWRTPSGDEVAWFADPDGNTLSLTQFAAG